MIESHDNNASMKDIAQRVEVKRTMFVTIKEFSKITGIKEHGLRELVRINGFPALKIGVKYMILVDEAMAWLRLNAKITNNDLRPLAL